jgi:DNA-binding NarL/FixJ family response regulator
MADETRIVIVARDERFRAEMRGLLSELPDVLVAGEAQDAVGAAVICALGQPDVVVMDALLPWIDARDFIRRIGSAQPATHILACTGSSTGELTAVAVAARPVQADGPREDLVGALRRACEVAGERPRSS